MNWRPAALVVIVMDAPRPGTPPGVPAQLFRHSNDQSGVRVVGLSSGPPSAARSPASGHLDPDRHVVRGFFPGAHMAVDTGLVEPVGGFGREHDVIDADAVVPLPGAGLVVPERVDAAAVV